MTFHFVLGYCHFIRTYDFHDCPIDYICQMRLTDCKSYDSNNLTSKIVNKRGYHFDAKRNFAYNQRKYSTSITTTSIIVVYLQDKDKVKFE